MAEYKAYPEYKDSGVEWLGEVPIEWSVRKLGNVLSSLKSGDATSNDRELSGKFPIYGATGEIGRTNNPRSAGPVILVGRVGSIGAINPIRSEEFWASDNALLLTSNKALIDFDFFTYILSIFDFNLIKSGMGQPLITGGSLKRQRIPLPPLETQQKIVEFLDAETAHIDAGIANMESLISLLTEKRSALISEMVTRGIPGDHTEFKDSGVEWLGEIPNHWKLLRAKNVLKFPKRLNKGLVNTNLLSLSYGNLKKKNINSAEGLLPENFEGYQLINKDEFVFRFTDLQNDQRSLRSAIHKLDTGIITSAYLVAAVKNYEVTNPDFFAYLMRGYDHQKVFYGIGSGLRQSVGVKEMSALPVTSPSVAEQKRIVEFLDEKTKQIDLAMVNAKALIVLMKEKRQTLISDVVTGKINIETATD